MTDHEAGADAIGVYFDLEMPRGGVERHPVCTARRYTECASDLSSEGGVRKWAEGGVERLWAKNLVDQRYTPQKLADRLGNFQGVGS